MTDLLLLLCYNFLFIFLHLWRHRNRLHRNRDIINMQPLVFDDVVQKCVHVNHKDGILYCITSLLSPSIYPKTECMAVQFWAAIDWIKLINPRVRHIDFLLKIKSKLVMPILKPEPPADEEEGFCTSAITFTCVVRLKEWVYNHGKSSRTTLSEPRGKKKIQNSVFLW